jgi:hypothetical protein
MGQLDRALAAKAIRFETYASLATDVRTRDKEGKEKGETKLRTEVNGVESDIKFLFALERGGSTTELRARAQRAADEGTYNYLQWLKTAEGQQANVADKIKWVHTEAARQFGLKAEAMDKKFLTGAHIPEANFQNGPLPVNHKKAPAAPAATIKQIQTNFDKGHLSRDDWAVLTQLGVLPKDVKQFLDSQKKFLTP